MIIGARRIRIISYPTRVVSTTDNGFDNLAAKDYAVQSIPSNFLIDAQGRIVAKNLRGEDLCSKVAELLAE